MAIWNPTFYGDQSFDAVTGDLNGIAGLTDSAILIIGISVGRIVERNVDL